MRIASKLSVLVLVVAGPAWGLDVGKLAEAELSRAVGPEGDGHASVVAFTKTEGSVRVDSAVVARGEIAREGVPSVLTKREAPWGTLEIASPEADRDAMVRALDIGVEGGERWLDGATASVAAILELLEPLDLTGLHLKIVVVPTNVAYTYEVIARKR